MSIIENPHYRAFINQYSFLSAWKAANSREIRILAIALHIIPCIPGVTFFLMTVLGGPTIIYKKKCFESLPTREEKIAYLARLILQFIGLGPVLLVVDLVGTTLAISMSRKYQKRKEEAKRDLPIF